MTLQPMQGAVPASVLLGWDTDCSWPKKQEWCIPESSIHRPVPTDEGAGGEEQKPEDGEAEAYTTVHVHTKQSKARDEVKDQSSGWTLMKEQIDKKRGLKTK